MSRHKNFEKVSIRERLSYFLSVINESEEEFIKKTRLSNSFLRQKSYGITSNNLLIISQIYSDLSLEWLITGKGLYLKKAIVDDIKLNFKKNLMIGNLTVEQLFESQGELKKLLQDTINEASKALKKHDEIIDNLKTKSRMNGDSDSV